MQILDYKGNNETLIDFGLGVQKFFSYQTCVCARLMSGEVVKTSTYYSQTTTKHINRYLRSLGLDPKKVREIPQRHLDNV